MVTQEELEKKNNELHLRQKQLGNSSIKTPEETIHCLVDRIKINQNEYYENSEEVEKDKEKQFKEMNIPERYYKESFDTYAPRSREDENNLKQLKLISEKKGYQGVVVFLGANGLAKTHLACSCLKILGGLYINIPKLEIEVRCSKDFHASENELQVLNRYCYPRFLVIDEIGRAIDKNIERSMIYYILNERYNSYKTTALISNFTYEEFGAYLGAAIVDRISEKRTIINFTGESYRKKDLS